MNKIINNKSKSANKLTQIEKPEKLNQKNIGELLKKLEDLNIVSSLNNAINEGKSLKEIILLFSKETKKLFSSLGATVYLLSKDSKYLLMQNSTLPPGIEKKVENIVRIKIPEIKISLKNESVYSRTLKQAKPQLINNPEDIQRLIYDFAKAAKLKNRVLYKTFKKITPKIYKLLNINSVLIVPLISNDKAIGIIDISREKPFRNNDLERFKAVSGIITTAIHKKLSEDRLTDSTYESNMILETGIDGMRVIDKDFNVLRVNKQFCKISGLSKSKNLAQKCYESFPGEHCHKPTCTVKKLLDGYSHSEREAEKIRTDGKVVPCMITALPLKDADGKIIGMVENYKDITERKNAEIILRAEKDTAQKYLDIAGVMIVVLDKDGKVSLINKKGCEILGYRKDDIIGKNWFDNFLPKKIRSEIKKVSEKLFSGEVKLVKYYENSVLTRSRKEKIISWHNSILNDDNGKIIAILSSGEDITEKKKSEEEINNLAKFPSENPSPVLRIDYEGKIIYQNEAYKKKVRNLKEGRGNHAPKQITDLINNISREKSEKQMAVDINLGKSVYEFSIKPIKKEGYINVYGRDITERKKTQKNLEKSYINLQKTLNDIIDTLASIVETKDPYTSGHQKRVAALAVFIAKELGLDKDKIEAIHTAAMIHDIGKINIPASILVRPGKISDIEYDMIKTHPQLGYDMIKRIEFTWPIAKIILQHHEKLDGSGYPNGLKDKDILLEAKILAVADIVEAMSSHRPYRPALGIKQALKEIKKGKGKLYDAEVVKACVKIITKKGFKF